MIKKALLSYANFILYITVAISNNKISTNHKLCNTPNGEFLGSHCRCMASYISFGGIFTYHFSL